MNAPKVPSKDDLLAQLHIGSHPPHVLGAWRYARCKSRPCAAAADVEVFTTGQGAFDESTIFSIDVHGKRVYLANRRSTVTIGRGGGGARFAFRNPPTMINSLRPTARDAEQETEALLEHLSHHPNSPPFLARQALSLVPVLTYILRSI